MTTVILVTDPRSAPFSLSVSSPSRSRRRSPSNPQTPCPTNEHEDEDDWTEECSDQRDGAIAGASQFSGFCV